MANPTGGFKRGILTSPTPGRSNNNAASKASTVEGKRIVAAKIASAVGAGGAPTRVINAFIQVKDYPGLDRYLCKHKIPTDILTSSLQRACMTSDSEAVQIFAKNGANVNYVDQFGTTLLHFAMRGGGNERVIQYLITYGLEYNTWRSEGMPLLHWACSMGYTQLVEYMVGTKDAPLQEADDSGRLPIHVAAVYGQPSVLSYLIRALSKRLCAVSVPPQYLDAVETHGRTAIAEETEDDSVSSENVLKRPEKVPLVILRNRVRRPTYCQEPGNAQLAAASNYLDLHQWTPLHHASCEDAINNYQDCLKILLDNGADPMLQTLQGKTALDLAYAAGRSQMLVDVLPKRQLIALLMRIDDIVPSNVRRRMQQQAQKSRSATESVLYPESVPGVMRQPYHQEPSTCSLTESVERTRKGYSFIRRLADNMDASADGYRKQPAWSTKTPKSEGANVMSVWRKILLNDNVELLETLRDSLVWREHRSDPAPNAEIDFTALNEKLGGQARNTSMNDFETSQNLTMEQMAELFSDCYENGTGVFSHVQANYQTVLKANDFRTVLRAMTGLFTFKTLSTEKVVILRPMYKSLLFLAIICGRFRVAEQLLRMRQFDLLPAAVLVVLILRRLRKEPSFPQQAIGELDRFIGRVESIAVDVLSLVFLKDKTSNKSVCHDILTVPLRTFGDMPLIDLCARAKCTELLSLLCCQRVLDERWQGVLVHIPPLIKWPTRLLPFTGLMYLEYVANKERAKAKVKRSPVKTFSSSLNRPQFSPQLSTVSQISAHSSHERPKSSSWRTVVSSLRTLLRCTRSPDGQSSKTSIRHSSTLSSSQSPQPNVVTVYDRLTNHTGYESSPRWYFLTRVYQAPSTKFFFHSIFHFVFLFHFSLICIFAIRSKPTIVEKICLAYIAGYALEEVRQMLIEGLRGELVTYFKDLWNWIDLLSIGFAGAGFCIRMSLKKVYTRKEAILEADDEILSLARNIYMISLNMFFMRTLTITYILRRVGPRLKMIADMLRKDLVPMLIVFAIFIASYGVWFQGLLYPNNFYDLPPEKRTTSGNLDEQRLTIADSMREMFKRAFYSMFEASTVLEESIYSSDSEASPVRVPSSGSKVMRMHAENRRRLDKVIGDPYGTEHSRYWELDTVLKFILIQSFSLQNRRQSLGENNNMAAGSPGSVPVSANIYATAMEQRKESLSEETENFAKQVDQRLNRMDGLLEQVLRCLDQVAARESGTSLSPSLQGSSILRTQDPSNTGEVQSSLSSIKGSKESCTRQNIMKQRERPYTPGKSGSLYSSATSLETTTKGTSAGTSPTLVSSQHHNDFWSSQSSTHSTDTQSPAHSK
ncbi:unnamed protein product [Calicophoron daubneyi]|uniref:Ion transport domain-containing protein n=1 Tax=Calicophoron daubneyi TaxID=300641 RepID=A0AAV2TY28_CALDB